MPSTLPAWMMGTRRRASAARARPRGAWQADRPWRAHQVWQAHQPVPAAGPAAAGPAAAAAYRRAERLAPGARQVALLGHLTRAAEAAGLQQAMTPPPSVTSGRAFSCAMTLTAARWSVEHPSCAVTVRGASRTLANATARTLSPVTARKTAPAHNSVVGPMWACCSAKTDARRHRSVT